MHGINVRIHRNDQRQLLKATKSDQNSQR
jgi:hypothetical protein